MFSLGDTLTLSATVRTDKVADEEIIFVNFYRYKGEDKYESISRTKLFDEGGDTEILLDSVEQSKDNTIIWKGIIGKEDPAGTYRLEFIYHNRTEYWDFIVKD